VRYPSITQVEADDGKEEVQGIEEGLERWLDVRIVGGSQVAPRDIPEEDSAEDHEIAYFVHERL
jgi:hypothetical protein